MSVCLSVFPCSVSLSKVSPCGLGFSQHCGPKKPHFLHVAGFQEGGSQSCPVNQELCLELHSVTCTVFYWSEQSESLPRFMGGRRYTLLPSGGLARSHCWSACRIGDNVSSHLWKIQSATARFSSQHNFCQPFIMLPIYLYLCMYIGLPQWLNGRESTCNAGDTVDMGLIPGSGTTPGGGYGNPLQYSCLENPMDRRAWWATVQRVTKSQTQLKWLSTHTHSYTYT